MANHFPFAAESVHAPVTDAEFRTYVLLCALAWQHHPEADPPFVELTYAELAEKHPRPVAVPTLRVRVMTLVKLGYLRREQVNRATWRTYVTGLAPLPPSGGGGTKAFSPKTPDKAGQPRPIIVQRNRGGEVTKPSADSRQPDRSVITLDADEGDRPMITLDTGEGDRPVITLDAKPSADSRQPDRPKITLDADEGDRPVITHEPDRPTITLDAYEGDRPMITHEPDRPTITLNDETAPSLSWGDMIRRNVDYSAYLDGDTSRIPEPKAPKGRLFQRETGDPVLARGRARERHFYQVTSPKPDRPVITQEEPSTDSRQPDRPAITLEPDRPMITLEPDRPVITLGGTEGDHPMITLEPDHPVPTFNVTEGDRPAITLEGDLAEGDRGVIAQTAEGDRPAITLAPSRAHAYARVRAHADQDQDQITDLTDPDLIKLDLKNKKSDQSNHTPKDLDRARGANPEADPEFSAWARTGNVVPDADSDFGLSAKTGMGNEALAGTDLPDSDSDFGLSARTRVGNEIPAGMEQSDSDPDFCFSSRTGVGDEILAGAELPDSDPDFGSSSRTGGGNGRSTLDVQALSSQPSASRFPGSNDSGHHASKNPPLTAPQTANSGPSVSSRHPATNPSPKASSRQASKEPSPTPASPLTAPQATVAGPSKPTRQPSKPSSLKASPPPSLDSILAGLDETHRQLAQDLLSLKPEPMDLKGVTEVMAKPVLTAAWYAWATDPANGVRKPAAYLRSMVRKGYFPPPRPGDEPAQPVSTVDADGVDRSNPNYDVWPGGFTVGKGEIFDPTTYVHPSRRNDLVWP